MVLMVVVVVAVGGLFVRLFACPGDPRLPLGLWKNLWKSLWIALWKSRPGDTYLYAVLDGSPMCKICLFGWAGHVQKQKEDGPRMRAEEEETAPFCSVSLCYDMFTT